jgi:mono/diheme cytochrome c family protein
VKFIVGVMIGIILVVGAGYFYFSTGRAPVATSDKPMPFERMLAKRALHARIDQEMPKSAPLPANQETYLAGAQVYREQCSVCHGLPGMQQSDIALGQFPKPPHLWRGKGVTDDPPGETYWKVENGIRLTGMPSFKGRMNDTQMWQVSLLLANADKISDEVKQALLPAAGAAGAMSKAQPPKKR